MSRFTLLAGLLLAFLTIGVPASAAILGNSQAEYGAISLQLPYFEDQTGSNSVVQAEVQLARFLQTRQIKPEPIIAFHNSGLYWVNIPLTNQSQKQDWQFELAPLPSSHISPVKSIALYAAGQEQPLVTTQGNSVNIEVKPGETINRYVLIETWPGVKTPLLPQLKTRAYVTSETMNLAQKLGLLWLVAGAICGAGLVQFLLARQPIQFVVAVNAVLLGIGTFLTFQSQVIPGIETLHPVILPLLINAAIGIGASAMLWVAASKATQNASLCVLPILVNLIVPALAFFNLETLLSAGIGLEYIPNYLLTLTGVMLLGLTVAFCFAEFSVIWYFPAWVALTAMPWLGSSYPFVASIFYVLMLGVAGVAAVFSHWRSMDNETASLQRRLRQELKASKEKYVEEHDAWDKKMENQRALLNELRQREQQRSAELEIAKKEADAANKAKSDFLAIISHEIRTPMNGIMGILEIIEQTPLTEKQFEYVEIIKNSGETMVTLLNDILDYSKIEHGIIDLEIIPFSLRKLVNSVATLMGGRSKDKGLTITVDISDELGDTFQGDSGRIRQILLNLVSNAVKFTEKGGVTIRVKPGSNNSVVFEIIDTGIGISEENQQKLFQPYAQADSSINRRFGGTGLGLNICRMLVEAMQGALGLRSVEGQGSTFWFDLPLNAAQASALEAPKPKETAYENNNTLYALVIDDNAVNLKVVSSLLEMDGHEVVTSLRGEDALRSVDQDRFDVVFVDMLMPEMDGKTFIEKLRQNPVAIRANVPVFALTGLADDESLEDITALGVEGVIVKPVTQAALRQAMEKVMNTTKQATAPAPAAAVETVPVVIDADALNMANLEELKQSLPHDTLMEIFDDLIAKAKELTNDTEKAATNHDYKTLGELGHNLKGMAGNFGLKSLMEHSALIERAIRDGENDKAVLLTQNSRRVLDQSLAAIEKWLKG